MSETSNVDELVVPTPPKLPVHAILDIETTGRFPGCGVLEIGIALIGTDPDGLWELKPDSWGFNMRTSRDELKDFYFREDADTIAWWETQPAWNWKRFADPALEAPSPVKMFNELNAWASKFEILTFWGNGPEFDMAILQTAMEMSFTHAFWDFRKVRSLRNVKGMFPEEWEAASRAYEIETGGLYAPHVALNDARKEASILLSLALQVEEDTGIQLLA